MILSSGGKNLAARAGKWKTNLSGEAAYQSFVPSPLPPTSPVALDSETVRLLIRANRRLAVLSQLGARIPNVNLFISQYVRKEALLSSQIEGTQATLEDVLDPFLEQNANRDVAEVINYIKATEFAIARLSALPLSNRLIKETHAVLMTGVRGQEKTPGQFRHSQNWLGGYGSALKNASYIPPAPEEMIEAMSDLEKYINADDDLDILVRAALIHYQFETIHPFLDGNGRVGRLLITLFLLEKGLLKTPALYISYFLKKNRVEYYDRLSEVRQSGNYEQWVKFFVRAIDQSAQDAAETIDKLAALHEENIALISGLGRASKTASRLFAYLEQNPIIETRKTASALGATFKTVNAAIERLCRLGILVRLSDKRRNRTFTYQAYLEILREGT
ncbi:MAG: Fic family protein [Synergistaceae bacterium]|jgi:Fic family protein|nr:Fic family protein [Synergistaceae bacterium]